MGVRVAVNGYGTIGKRVAYAISKQNDMQLIGVSKTKPDYNAILANRQGIPLYVPSEDHIKKFEEFGIKVAGIIEEMIKEADVIVDATPKGVGAKYKVMYEKFGKKAIFQGGEKAEIAEVSFSALCNYREALGKKYVRVVSCNTTALCRIICALRRIGNLKKIRATIVRRGADPHEYKKGPIESLVPDPVSLPSHHALDVKTVIPDVDIVTAAVVVPTTRMHLHIVNVEMTNKVSREELISILNDTPRILLVRWNYGFWSTGNIVEWARDILRPRYDIYEVIVWEESITVDNREVWLMYGVHQEAIVVPENVDAIRAIMKLEDDPIKSIQKTDASLGILKRWSI